MFFDKNLAYVISQSVSENSKNWPHRHLICCWLPLAYYYLNQEVITRIFVNCFGVNFKVFRELVLDLFNPIFDKYTVVGETGEIREQILTLEGKPKGMKKREANEKNLPGTRRL